MSTDYAVICDKCRRERHLGQDGGGGASFGYGSNDAEGQRKAAEFAFEHASNCGKVRVVHSDGGVPDGYVDEDAEED